MAAGGDGFMIGFAAGSRVAGYLLEQQVGVGGMAVVYRARDERLSRLVALKILAPVLTADESFRKRFIRESRATAAVDDPHIIPVYEAGETGGVLFIAMRYVAGGDVRTLVRRGGPLTADRAAAIVSAVASALDAAHAADLIHRDVKPANMLLDARPGRPDHVYLSDFGLSTGHLSSVGLTGTGQFVGTPDYSAPEQVEGKHVDGRTDQYALACAAFELLSGAPPFARDRPMAVMYAQLTAPPPPLTAHRPDLSHAADGVLARALAKDPPDRYPSCRDFADAFRQALGLAPDHPGSAPVPQPDHPATVVGAPEDAVPVAALAEPTYDKATQQPAPKTQPGPASTVVPTAQPPPAHARQPETEASPGSDRAVSGRKPAQPNPGDQRTAQPAADDLPASAPDSEQRHPATPARRRVLTGLAGIAAAGGLAAAGWELSHQNPPAPSRPSPSPTPSGHPAPGHRPGTKLWSFLAGDNVGSRPTVAGTTVYFGSDDHNVYAVDTRRGKEIWHYRTGGKVVSSPALAAGIVYVGSEDFHLYALNAVTGKRLWSYATSGIVESSPAVAGHAVWFGSQDGNLYALRTGLVSSLLWKVPIGNLVDSSPADASDVVYIGSGDHNVYAVSAASGKVLWTYRTGGYVDSSPAVAAGVVYVGSSDGSLYALQTGTSGRLLWTFPTGPVSFSSPAVADGVVYIGSDKNNVYAVRHGNKVWSHATGGPVDSSPAVANGVIYVGSNDRNVYAISADRGKTLWTFETQGHVFSSPAFAERAIYVGSDDHHLYAIQA